MKSVRLKRQRDGAFRAHWYGQYQIDGKNGEVNLNVKWRGTPPASGSMRDPGDARFEASRKDAEDKLAAHMEDARHKGRAEHLTERLIESKTGRQVEYARIQDLPQRWRAMGRERPPTERYLAACDAHFNRFTLFMRKKNRSAVHLYEVKEEEAAAFVTAIQTGFDDKDRLSLKTVRDAVKLLNKAFACYLPVGAGNPFAALMGRRTSGENETVHRKPFTPEELQAILDVARKDDFMYPLIVTAACTGMRRGDVCRLTWNAIDLPGGMLEVKTSKTGAEVEIPIFEPLRAVLPPRNGTGKAYVFPEAARMLVDNPDALTWRFKKIVAMALKHDQLPANPQTTPPPDLEAIGVASITENFPDGARRARMLDVFRRYCAGTSFREIVKATGYIKSTVSSDLHTVEELTGTPFLRVQGPRTRCAIRKATQAPRERGQRAASVWDWHTLRATFVTLALSAGCPVELVRRVTGHATVEIVLKHYFRPDREQFRAALTNAMPGILTGGKRVKLKPADELASLAGKFAAGSATDEDKARFRKLAAKV